MEYIPQLTKSVESHANQPTSKFWKVLLQRVYELLDKVHVFYDQIHLQGGICFYSVIGLFVSLIFVGIDVQFLQSKK